MISSSAPRRCARERARGAEDRLAPASRRSRDGRARAARLACRASGCPPRARAPARARARARGSSGASRSRASAIRSTSSSRSGRNSCSGGSSSRIVIGRPVHRLEDPLEVRPAAAAAARRARARRPASSSAMIMRCIFGWRSGGHEHVLGPAEPDALGAELARPARVLRRVGVGAHAERAQLVAPAEHRLEARVDVGRHQRHVVERDLAGRAVDGDQVALAQDALADPHLAGVQVDVERRPRR